MNNPIPLFFTHSFRIVTSVLLGTIFFQARYGASPSFLPSLLETKRTSPTSAPPRTAFRSEPVSVVRVILCGL